MSTPAKQTAQNSGEFLCLVVKEAFMTLLTRKPVVASDASLPHVATLSLSPHSENLRGGCLGSEGGSLRNAPLSQRASFLCSTDFSVQVNSTSLSSPTGRGGPMATPALHPSMGPSLGGPLGSPSQLHSPINGMGPPFSVISSPMGPHAMSGPSTPSLGFGAGSPQVSPGLAG